MYNIGNVISERNERDTRSIESRSRQYGTIFDNWEIQESIWKKRDDTTAVFKLRHTGEADRYSAVKVINLIEQSGRQEDLSHQQKKEYA